MFSGLFWRDSAERAIATAAQALIAVWGADGLGVLAVNWGDAFSIAGMAAVLSVLKSIVASRIGDRESASLAPKVGAVDLADDGDPEISPEDVYPPSGDH